MTKVMVFGTFDLLHEGHKYFLKNAKMYGDELIAIIARDENVKYVKNSYPHDDENKRKENVESLPFIDHFRDKVILGDLKDRYKVLDEFKPDVVCVGYDQKTGELEEKLKEKGLKTVIKKIRPYHPKEYKTSIKKKFIMKNIEKKEKEKRALFVGRFQPLHKGHVRVIKELSERYKEVVIVIGSSNKNDDKNPFEAEHRKNMIIETLKKEGADNCSIFIVPDIADDNKWVEHLLSYTGNVDVVITGNDLVKRLFEQAGIKVEFIKRLYYNLSSTNVRRKIKNREEWEKDVHEEVHKYLKEKELV